MSSENTAILTDSLAANSQCSEEGSLEISPSRENWEYVIHDVDHIQQRFNWDCGLACVMMLLSPQQREEFKRNFDSICVEEGFNQSTWTIDLCYLLKRFSIKHKMYSVLLGVNEEHKKYKYYDNIFELDRERVDRRFREARSLGIRVAQGSVSAAQLRRHLRLRGPAIALVDAGYLPCDLCKQNKLRSEIKKCFGGSYTGHYVLVVGVRGSRVLFRDPAQRARLCAASSDALQLARTAPGTDEDIILVHQTYRPRFRSKSQELDSEEPLKMKPTSSLPLHRSRSESKDMRWSSCALQ